MNRAGKGGGWEDGREWELGFVQKIKSILKSNFNNKFKNGSSSIERKEKPNSKYLRYSQRTSLLYSYEFISLRLCF